MATIDEIREKKEAAAETEDAPRRGPGRPKKVTAPQSAPSAPEETQIPPEVIEQMLGSSIAQLGQIPCLHYGVTPLTPEETTLLVTGSTPLLKKYLPGALGQWGPEILFIGVVVAIYGQRFTEYRQKNLHRGSDGHGKILPVKGTDGSGATAHSGGPAM